MADLCKDFDKLPLKYQEETKKLCENLDAAISLNEKRDLFESFTKNYTMLPALWQKWLRLERENTGTNNQSFKHEHLFAMEQKALNDFYYYKFMEEKDPNVLTTADFWFFKLLNASQHICYLRMYQEVTKNLKESQNLAKMYLTFPHHGIEDTFNIYRLASIKPVPKYIIEKYKFNKNLYNQIMSANEDDEKWLELIFSVKDFEFIRQNVETRIAENPANKKLWKYYIKFLEGYPENIQILLSVYNRYCRLFIDDHEMKAEFKKLELKEKIIEPTILLPTLYHNIRGDQTEFIRRYYNHSTHLYPQYINNYANQCIPFQKTIMTYLMDKSSPQLWHKLFQTCKYFFYKKQTPIIHQLRIVSGFCTVFTGSYSDTAVENFIEFEKESVLMTADNTNLAKIKNSILSNYLNIPKLEPIFLSNLISSLHSSQIKFLFAGHYKITINEFDFLVGHGRVEVVLIDLEIKDANGEWITVEDLVARFPFGRVLDFTFTKYNENSAAKLVELQRFAKLEQFQITKVLSNFNAIDFINFVAKNTTDDGIFDVTFDSTVPEDTVAAFKNTVEQTFANLKMKPHFSIKKD